MADFLTASLVLALLLFSSSDSAGQRNIRAESGENVILTCRAAENKDVIVVEWRRTNQTVCFYRKNGFVEKNNECINSPAHLLDVKNGNMSLVLKNVTTNDTGTYECRVVQTGNNRRKRSQLGGDPICIIYLRVEPGNKDGPKDDGVNWTGLIVGLLVCTLVAVVAHLLLLVAVVAAVLYKRSRGSSQKSKRPQGDVWGNADRTG